MHHGGIGFLHQTAAPHRLPRVCGGHGTDGLRIDLQGTGVRVTSVDPGMVETEFSEVRFHGDRARAEAVYRGMTPLAADDVAEVIHFAATRPAHVSLADVLVLPTDQASATHVHRS